MSTTIETPAVTDEKKPPPLLDRFFDAGLKAVFTHFSQLMNGSLVVAAGSFTLTKGSTLDLPGIFNPIVAGWVLTTAGVVLLVLNFFQGLYHLMKLKHGWGWMALLIIFYVFVSLRAAQLFVAFRNAV